MEAQSNPVTNPSINRSRSFPLEARLTEPREFDESKVDVKPAKPSLLARLRGMPKWKSSLIVAALTVVVLFVPRAIYHWLTTESTDDAFVTAHVHTMSSHVPGVVAQVLVEENQMVKKGDILVKLDPRDALVNLKIAQANYSKAHKDLGRMGGIHEFLPDEKPIVDQYTASVITSEAELERARLALEYTNVWAVTDGRIGKRTVETGQQIQAGQALMALVEPNPWVEANFKESQVKHIRPGQKVEISVDAIPDKTFTGHVESIAPASGSTFSLLPPDNATGNFTKIVQRIPVKVVFDADSVKGFEDRVSPGMSTEVTIDVR